MFLLVFSEFFLLKLKLSDLSNTCVLITRPEGQAGTLKDLLESRGATVEIQPAIAILPPDSWVDADEAIERLNEYLYVVFSSVNGVTMFLNRLTALGRGVDELKRCTVAAVGSTTAKELERRGVDVKLVPEEFRAENLASAICADLSSRGQAQREAAKALLLRASRGRDILQKQLESAGVKTTQVVVYKSEDVLSPKPEIAEKLKSGAIDFVALTSSAIAQSTINMFGDLLRNTKIVCISPITAQTVEKNGFSVDAVAEPYTMEGLVEAIIKQ